MPRPHSERLSMWVRSSSQVMTPGVGSGGTKLGHPGHDGYEPTSLHISSHMPASLFWSCMRCCKSSATHAFSPPWDLRTCRNADVCTTSNAATMNANRAMICVVCLGRSVSSRYVCHCVGEN